VADPAPLTELATNAWDGPDPHPGAVVVDGDRAYVVERCAEGAGLGHWRLWCRPTALIHLHRHP
jgi:hypothetical protein